MVISYFVFFAFGLVAFFLLKKFNLLIRITVALIVFLVPSIALTVWINRVGDKPPEGAVTVIQKSPNERENAEPKD